jgi:O-antigen/teichoic acid export membrane protein
MSLALSLGLVLNPTNGLYLTPLMNRNAASAQKLTTAIEYQRHLMLIIGLAGMVLILFPKLVLTVLFSAKFGAAARYVWLFVIWQCLVQLAGVYQAILIGVDDLPGYAVITCAGHIGQGVLAWFLVPRLNVIGIALALIAGSGFILLGSWLRLAMRQVGPAIFRVNAIVPYTGAAIIAAGLIFRDLGEFDSVHFSLRVLTLAAFTISLYAFLSIDDRRRIRELWETTRARTARGTA